MDACRSGSSRPDSLLLEAVHHELSICHLNLPRSLIYQPLSIGSRRRIPQERQSLLLGTISITSILHHHLPPGLPLLPSYPLASAACCLPNIRLHHHHVMVLPLSQQHAALHHRRHYYRHLPVFHFGDHEPYCPHPVLPYSAAARSISTV